MTRVLENKSACSPQDAFPHLFDVGVTPPAVSLPTMPKRSAVDVECGEDQEAADARLAASLQQAFDDTSRPRRRPAVDPALPFAVPELRRVGPRSHTHRFAGKKVPHGVAARSGAPGDLLAAVPDTGASQAHSAGGDSPAAEGGASAPVGAAAGLLSGGGAAPGVPPPQRHPKAVRPPRRTHFDKGCLVWARLPGVPVRWPGRMCVPGWTCQRGEAEPR